jgi:methionyl aminopeptidase
MNEQVYEKYKRAGKIAGQARDFGVGLIKPGVSFLSVAQSVESFILNNGAGVAFPVNISINEVAAHYTPCVDDSLVFSVGDVVKLDVGSHVEGYIADTAITVEVGSSSYDSLIKASSQALEDAISFLKAGVLLSDIGCIVEEKITEYGFKPIDNLTGHGLEQFVLHSGISVPSISNTSAKVVVGVDDVLAIEPFASDGAGHVKSGAGSNIYVCSDSLKSRLMRDNRLKSDFLRIKKFFPHLPFASRWCHDKISQNIDPVLRRLSLLGYLKHYPMLIDSGRGMVSQKEHTVIVFDDGCEVIT